MQLLLICIILLFAYPTDSAANEARVGFWTALAGNFEVDGPGELDENNQRRRAFISMLKEAKPKELASESYGIGAIVDTDVSVLPQSEMDITPFY